MLTQTQDLPQYLLKLSQQQATGELVLALSETQGDSWKLYFYSGRLIYATGGVHPVRRWYRAFRQYAPDFAPAWLKAMQVPGDYWEVDFINQAIQQNRINLNQVKGIVQSIIYEVMLSLVDHPLENPRWHEHRLVAQQAVFLAVDHTLEQVQQSYQQWHTFGAGHLPTLSPQQLPYLSPIVRNEEALLEKYSLRGYQRLSPWMQGNATLWDIAAQTRRSLPEVIHLLMPLLQQKMVELISIKDLPAPYKPPPVTPPPKKVVSKGLIACIDDSPLVSKAMAQILQPLGYEILPVMNPLQQISTLLSHKPDLIFLDLIMPNVNGYELCNFLRKTSTFQNTPIVILTGRDGMIDRVRTKIAGSSDFLAKPPDRKKVIQIVQKYIGKADS
jgi:chemotaxis family two-component system response regulator PixG